MHYVGKGELISVFILYDLFDLALINNPNISATFDFILQQMIHSSTR